METWWNLIQCIPKTGLSHACQSDYSEQSCKPGTKHHLVIQPNRTIRPANQRANLVTSHTLLCLLLRDEQDLASFLKPLVLCYVVMYFSKFAWYHSDRMRVCMIGHVFCGLHLQCTNGGLPVHSF